MSAPEEATPAAVETPQETPAPVTAPAAAASTQPAAAQSASLYVGDLNQEITEAMLFEKFNAVGPVASIRVCRDAITRRSLGYAYVNFVNAADATTALNDMNFDPIAGRPCRIMWSQRDPATRRSGVGNIFIKNLDKSIDNKALFDTFGAFGDILSCKVVQDSNGESRGFGFVHYSTQKAADESIEKVNGMLLCDQKVYVGPFKSRDVRVKDMASREQEFTNLYVKNLDEDVTEEKLGEMFGKFGNVTSRKIMMGAAEADDADSKSKCFGFVAFETNDMAKAAVEALHDSDTAGGKKLYVTRAQKRAERLAALQQQHMAKKAENQARYKGVNLYVKNLDDTITDDKLRESFEEFGAITSAKIMRDERQQSKGFGFVCFNSADEATKAVTEMNGKIIEKKPLYVALAQRKDERRRQIAMAHNQRLHSMRMQQQMFPGQGMPGGQPGSMMYMPQMAAQVPAQYGRYQPGMAAGMARPPANYMRQQQQQQQQMMAAGQFRGAMPGQQGQQVRMQQQAGPRGNQRQTGRGQGKGRQPYNVRQQQMQQQQPPAQQPALLTQGQEPLTASALASATNAEQKQMLGERLFPLIQGTHAEQAGKITGMLLEMDNSELLHLLEDVNALNAKTREAVKVLEDHSRQVQDGGAK